LCALVFDPTTNVYASESTGVRAWKSIDSGQNFSAANVGLPANAVNAFAVDATVPATVYAGTNGAGIRQDYAGTAVPYSPKFTSNATADYEWSVSSTWLASIGATVTQQSLSYATVGPTPIDRIDPYVLIDLRAGLSTQDGKYKVQLWGKNVANRFYWNNVSHPYDTVVRYAGMPATYGVTFSARF